ALQAQAAAPGDARLRRRRARSLARAQRARRLLSCDDREPERVCRRRRDLPLPSQRAGSARPRRAGGAADRQRHREPRARDVPGRRLLTALVAVAVFAATWWATGALIEPLRRRAVLDRPNERSSHAVPTPRGGGLAVMAALLPAWALFVVLGSAP